MPSRKQLEGPERTTTQNLKQWFHEEWNSSEKMSAHLVKPSCLTLAAAVALWSFAMFLGVEQCMFLP